MRDPSGPGTLMLGVAAGATPDGPLAASELAPVSARFHERAALGVGGMGVVVAADDRTLERTVACKRLGAAPRAEHGRLLVSEARILGQLDHPAIPPVYELGADAHGRPVMVMRKVDGETLTAVLQRLAAGEAETCARFGRDRLLRMFVALCHAIEHAHRRGVVHLDLKPGNVMVGPAGAIAVVDWGIAIRIGALEPSQVTRAGTPGYVAPEVLDPTVVPDPRADVYALGCILFELLALEPLHEPGARPRAGAVDARPSSRAGGRGVAEALDRACVRATQPDRDQRCASAGALATAITDYLDEARDQEVRIATARRHLAAARAARATDPERALVGASSALALAPAPEAADLVRTLLAADEPLPARAADELARLARLEERNLARAAAVGYLGFLLLPLTLLVQGGAAPGFLSVVVALTAALIGLSVSVARGGGPRGWLWWSLAGLAGLAALFSRYLGPFVLTPPIVALAAAGAMMHPRVRRPALVIAALCAVPFVVSLLELAGVLAPTSRIDGDRWYLTSTVSALASAPTLAGLIVTCVAFLLVAAALGRMVAAPAHRARRALAVQTWHLDQLLRLSTPSHDTTRGRRRA